MRSMTLWLLLLSAQALAQDQYTGGVVEEPVDRPPEVRPAPAPVTVVAKTARERMKGRVGFGFLGTAPVLQADNDTPSMTTFPPSVSTPFKRVSVPMLGVRWWTPVQWLGLEVGLGAMISASGSDIPTANGSNITDGPTTTELLFHFSAPLALASTEHTIVFIAPELRIGRSTETTGDPRNALLSMTYDVSLKAGVEIFFSFINLPNLSLEAGVRAGVIHELRTFPISAPLSGPVQEGRRTETRFATSLVANPWDLFTSTLAARYYF
jgi:hypothetical protein